MSLIRNQKILVAVLNWGLGHATRSIPIVQSLLDNENEVHLASDGAAGNVLREAFKHLPLLELPAYDIRYRTSSMVWNMVGQLPKIWKAKEAEHRVVVDYCQRNKIELVISDNRYGCYLNKGRNIFVSHQLNLQLPFGAKMMNRFHARLLRQYGEVWIPDVADQPLTGLLSDPKHLDPATAIKFIGIQSRLKKMATEIKYDIAVILSGPEPQRSKLEEAIRKALKNTDLSAILVRGKVSDNNESNGPFKKVVNYASSDLLSKIFAQSSFIISRSGYSTIMDLKHLGGKALFIPTPGQTEQLYLAKRIKELDIADFQYQGALNIESAFDNRTHYAGF